MMTDSEKKHPGTQRLTVILVLTAIVAAALTSVIWISQLSWLRPREAASDRNSFITSKDLDKTPGAYIRQKNIVSRVNGNRSATFRAKYNPSGELSHCSWLPRPAENVRFSQDDEKRHGSAFDARIKWKECVLLHQSAVNQGACGSCWAAASAAAMSDRICIGSAGVVQPRLSVEDVLTCSQEKYDIPDSDLCLAGGTGVEPFEMWERDGIVTGGLYGTTDGCKPYSVDARCGGPCDPRVSAVYRTLSCKRQCGKWYGKTYSEDKFYGKGVFKIGDEYTKRSFMSNASLILDAQAAIEMGGPIVGVMPVHEDFLHYSSGIYRYTAGNFCYGHIVKILGWGKNKETGIFYWIIANSWGESWGENGFGKVDMGHFKYYVYGNPLISHGELNN